MTVEEYKQYLRMNNEIKNNSDLYGSPIGDLFIDNGVGDYVFNDKNWCGGDILRKAIIDCYDGYDLDAPELPDGVKYWYIDDENIVVFDFSEIDSMTNNVHGVLYMRWYKERGHTELIEFNGCEITLEDYVMICNAVFPYYTDCLYERMCKEYARYKQRRQNSHS